MTLDLSILNRESDFTKLLATMENRGVLIDQDLCRDQAYRGKTAKELALHALGGRKPTSNKDMQELFIELGIRFLPEHTSTVTGMPSFNKAAMEDYSPILEAMSEEAVQGVAYQIMSYRGWEKSCSTYYNAYLDRVHSDGRIRPSLNRMGTVTGRLSCSKPNLQQIPKETGEDKPWNRYTKKVFVPKPGYRLLNVDYSQLEFRLAAQYARQQNLVEIFNRSIGHTQQEIDADPDFFDIFNNMSTRLGRDRNACKTLTYAKLYGASPLKIAIMLGEKFPQGLVDYYFYRGDDRNSLKWRDVARQEVRLSEAGKFYADWEFTYPNMVALAKAVQEKARRQHHISYWTGRQRHFPNGYNANKAFNSLIQGGGAEIVTSAMNRLFHLVDDEDKCRIILQVHDSVLFEVREELAEHYEQLTKQVMEDVASDYDDVQVYFATKFDYWN